MKPKIVMDNEVWQKVMHWVNKSQYEVSGLGTVKVEPDGVIRVVSAMLLPQKNGHTHTDIEAEEVNKALFDLRESAGTLKWWWHSHVNMNVFWSSTDMDTIKKIGAGGWFAATVFNKKREVRSAYYGQQGQVTPWGNQPLFIDELATEVAEFQDPRATEWDAEYEKNVQISSYTTGNIWHQTDHGVWTSGESSLLKKQADTYDEASEPPPHRPTGMSKRNYKAWKKSYREKHGDLLAIGRKVTQGLSPLDVAEQELEGEEKLDAYGFTQDDQMELAANGWSITDVDACFQQDFTPAEISELAVYCPPGYVIKLAEQGHSAEEILDMVMGLGSHGAMDRGYL